MKKKYKVLLALGILLVLFVLLFNIDNIRLGLLPKYDFIDSGYSIGSTIDVDGVIYEEINEDMYNDIRQELKKQDIEQNEYKAFGRIDYIMADYTWNYIICGNRNISDRILLKGEDTYVFHDSNYPKIYFCRQDILRSLEGQGE